MLKEFHCLNCKAVFGQTDGKHLLIPTIYRVNDKPTVNLVTIRCEVILECGRCGRKRRFTPSEMYCKTPLVEQKVLTPA